MEFREFDPLPDLAAIISCVWTLEGHAGEMDGEAQPVLPDGHPELVLHLGDPFERIANIVPAGPDREPRAERQPLMLFAGQLTEQLTLRPTGRMAVVGLRFHPYGAAALLRVPLAELTGITPAVDEFDPGLARALTRVRDVTDDVATAAMLAQQVVRCWMDPSRIDSRVRAAVAVVVRRRGRVGIEELSRTAGVTRRHLERRFMAAVGLSPKKLARITRFQHALRLLQNSDLPAPGTTTAVTCGYADQSHFIRDFRDLSGSSPSQHLLRQGQLTGFFI